MLTNCPYTEAVHGRSPRSAISRRQGSILALGLCALMPLPGQSPTECSSAPGRDLLSVSDIAEDDTRECVGRFVNERLATWQQRLKLGDWTISLVTSRRTDLKPRTLGGIRWDKRKKTAVIAILDPAEYRLPFREMLQDIEFTIVHELIHLELASLPKSEASRSNEEHAVNHLTQALLGLAKEK